MSIRSIFKKGEQQFTPLDLEKLNNQTSPYQVAKKARSSSRAILAGRIAKIGTLAVVLSFCAAYLISFLVLNTGAFTVRTLNNTDDFKISLSETGVFESENSRLDASGNDEMGDTTFSDINWTTITDAHGGMINNTTDYTAYNFFLRNEGETQISYRLELGMTNVTNNADTGIRVAIIRNEVDVNLSKKPNTESFKVYAKAAAGGGAEPYFYHETYSGNELVSRAPSEETTTVFKSETQVADEVDIVLEASAIHKYSIVVWFEGTDPECTNDIMFGNIKFKLDFSILNTAL